MDVRSVEIARLYGYRRYETKDGRRVDEGIIMQEQLSRAKQGENHEMMDFERETLRSNWPFNKDVIARAEEQISTYHMKGCMLRMRYLYSPCSFGHFLQQRVRPKRKKPVALATGFIDSLYEKLGAWK